MPIEYALPKVHRFLQEEGVRDKITVIASGGVRTPHDLAKIIALGADGVCTGTADLVALECVRCHNCESGRGCARGIATTDPELMELIEKGRLKPTRRVEGRVTYHDPCYLGRHNEIYEPPRGVLKAIPGIELVEMERNRENSLCCGGGGGGLWNEVPAEERFSVLRVEEAAQTGAEIIAAACPYCISMFEDALKTAGKEEEMRVMDISELLLESLES